MSNGGGVGEQKTVMYKDIHGHSQHEGNVTSNISEWPQHEKKKRSLISLRQTVNANNPFGYNEKFLCRDSITIGIYHWKSSNTDMCRTNCIITVKMKNLFKELQSLKTIMGTGLI